MSDNILDDLDGLLVSREMGDETFRNELSYYGALKGVKVDDEVKSVYDRKVSVATNAARIIKSDKHTIKHAKRGIEETEIRLKQDRLGMVEMVQEIRRARKEWKSTMPFTDKARQAHQRYVHLKMQFKERNRNKRRMKERISEDKVRLTEKEAEIKEQSQVLEEAKTYIEKLEKGIRRQFDVVNKMLATREFIKSKAFDPNAPGISAEYKAAVIEFTQLTKEPLKISIVEPLTDQTSKLMQVFARLQSLAPDKDKQAIAVGEQQRIQARKDYFKRLEDPSLDALDTDGR